MTEKKRYSRAITEGNDMKIKRIFTDEQRLQVVRILRENGYKYRETSRQVGINECTLRTWAARYKEVSTDNAVSIIAQRVENEIGAKKINFITKNFKKMDELAEKALNRALVLIEEEEDLSKVNQTIKIMTDFIAKMKEDGSQEEGPSNKTVNLIQQSIQQCNMIVKKEGD